MEQGTHDELMAAAGVYHTLVQMQQMQGAASEDEEEEEEAAPQPGAHLEAVPEVGAAAAAFAFCGCPACPAWQAAIVCY